MKRLISAALALCLALVLAACGKGPGGADIFELGAELSGMAEALPDMTSVSSEGGEATGAELFPYLSDMDYSLVAGFYLSYATGGSAEEIALIKVKDAGSLPLAQASLERHLEGRRNLFRTYDPAGAALLDGARISASGDVAALIICENSAEVAGAFRRAMG